MAESYVMAIDEGTTNTRAIIFDHAGNKVADAQQEFPQYFLSPVEWNIMLTRFGILC